MNSELKLLILRTWLSDWRNTQKNLTSSLWSSEKAFWNIRAALMTSLRWNRRKWLKSTNFSVVTVLSWVSHPRRGMFENMGKYNPQRQKRGFKYPWRLLKWWVRCDQTHKNCLEISSRKKMWKIWSDCLLCHLCKRWVWYDIHFSDPLFVVTGSTSLLSVLLGSTFFMISCSISILCCLYLCASGTVNVL